MSPAAALPTNSPAPAGGAGPVRHLGIIMDGNGRWAKARLLPRIAGHRAGVEAVRRTVKAAPDLGIEVLTLYAFSSENWKRPADEVTDLMGLLKRFVQSEIDELDRNGVRLSCIGDWQALAPDLVALLADAQTRTAGNTRLRLVMALNYGGQDELARAVRRLLAAGGTDINPDSIAAHLDTADLPLPDAILRTSGEMRLSNFLMWQSAYAEFIVTETLWPDFDAKHLADAVATFAQRERRFGGR